MRSHDLYKMFFANSQLQAPMLGNLCIYNDQHITLEREYENQSSKSFNRRIISAETLITSLNVADTAAIDASRTRRKARRATPTSA